MSGTTGSERRPSRKQGVLWAALAVLVALGVLSRLHPPALAWAALAGGLVVVALLGLVRVFSLDAGRPVLLAGAGLAAAWFASRPPWGEVAAAVLWAGAVIIATGIVAGRRGGERGNAGILFLMGLVSGGLTGLAVGQTATPGAVALVVVVLTGRFAAWTLLDRADGRWTGPLALLAIALPGLYGVWAVAAAGIEAAALHAAARVDARASAWPYALGGIGVVVGLMVATGAVI